MSSAGIDPQLAQRFALDGRVALVTGASSGLGRHFALTLARAGAGVADCASKAGLIRLTQAMALERARAQVRVNALAPGYVATELNHDFLASSAGEKLRSRMPQQRFGRAEDLDGALLLLASEAGSFITGSVLAVDGGHLVSSL